MGFNIIFYKSSAEEKRLYKSGYLEQVLTVTGTLREETSIVRPVLLIDTTTILEYRNVLPDFNYAYISDFGRYYFVTDIVSVRNNLWEVSLECDVLFTYRFAIQKCVGFVDRCARGYNPMVIDNLVTVTSEVDIETATINNELFDIDDGSVVLSGFRIGIEAQSS